MMNLRDFLKNTIVNMKHFLVLHFNKQSYTPFCETIRHHCIALEKYVSQLTFLTPFSISFNKFYSLGQLLHVNYILYDNRELQESIQYSFGFQGYLDNLRGVAETLATQRVSFVSLFSEPDTDVDDDNTDDDTDDDANDEATYIKDITYPLTSTNVKNTVHMKHNMIITGPNASGKTTILKMTLINIILSQQFGLGYYTFAKFRPYTHVHSYLNIPDSSGRDSLFQAECRRCKDILDIVKQSSKTDHHICIFDELYSGTNYQDAILSATSFLKYLSTFPNVDFMLTTHFTEICNTTIPSVANYQMFVKTKRNDKDNDDEDNNDNEDEDNDDDDDDDEDEDDDDNDEDNDDENDDDKNDFEYTYMMIPGVSNIRGGAKILKQMNYPNEILQQV
jgi:energy-coupling factor transporter ATP-binding protein EcfA2